MALRREVQCEGTTLVTRRRRILFSDLGSSAESGAHACVLRHLRRCSRFSLLTVSRFPVNRQSFRTYHLPHVTGILPALSATLFGVSRCAIYLYCSSVFWGTLFCECLCLLLMLFVCFFGDVVWCVVQSVTYIVLVFFGRRLVCGWVCYIVFWGGKDNGSAYCGSC